MLSSSPCPLPAPPALLLPLRRHQSFRRCLGRDRTRSPSRPIGGRPRWRRVAGSCTRPWCLRRPARLPLEPVTLGHRSARTRARARERKLLKSDRWSRCPQRLCRTLAGDQLAVLLCMRYCCVGLAGDQLAVDRPPSALHFPDATCAASPPIPPPLPKPPPPPKPPPAPSRLADCGPRSPSGAPGSRAPAPPLSPSLGPGTPEGRSCQT
mmetsp:Transcript_14397/g.36330  ORF Transcript_14397/g.36330 Transcript_14397/m.36330 type:complete len:209 (-) Transcript_14397:314-940(-)